MKKSEDLMKIGKIREKIRKPDKFPERKIIISYLRNKPSILWRNMVKTALKSEDLRCGLFGNDFFFFNFRASLRDRENWERMRTIRRVSFLLLSNELLFFIWHVLGQKRLIRTLFKSNLLQKRALYFVICLCLA